MYLGKECVLLDVYDLPQYKVQYGIDTTDSHRKCHIPQYIIWHKVTGKVLFVYQDIESIHVVKNWWSLHHSSISRALLKISGNILPHYRTLPHYKYHRWQILARDVKVVSIDTTTYDPTPLYNALEWLVKPMIPVSLPDYYKSQAERYNYHRYALKLHPIYFYLL
jgi:hypothetical protein